ncbi:MAG: 1-phosphofructokinase family hexose kinase [Microbacterium sp.]|nr:1-phosphofructokinase family hexose kinase [Microbacterium sp.]
MIVTVTANPALDRTILLEAPLHPGEVQAAASEREDAGGKGLNVARVLVAADAPTLAVLPLAEDDPLRSALSPSRVPLRTIGIAGHCRTNIAITDPAGITTKLNLRGPVLSDDEAAALVDEVVAAVDGARWLVLAGSLPPGVGPDFYVMIIRAVRTRWGSGAPRIAVDASGPALAHVVAEGHPDLIKPNDDELAELAGTALGDGDDLAREALAAARRLVPAQVATALVTLGGRGAVLVSADRAWVAVPPPIRVRSTVGAGDSSLAGYLLAESSGAGPEACLASAIRHGAAAASLPGTQAPSPRDLPIGDITVAPLIP